MIQELTTSLISKLRNYPNYNQTAFIVMGCGGTGSWFIPALYRFINYELANPTHSVILYDADKVEQKNVGRQNFSPGDIDRFKAEVMHNRYAVAYNMVAQSSYYAEYLEDVTSIYNAILKLNSSAIVLIDCVDNNTTRKEIAKALYCIENQLDPTSSLLSPLVRETRPLLITWLSLSNNTHSGELILSTTGSYDEWMNNLLIVNSYYKDNVKYHSRYLYPTLIAIFDSCRYVLPITVERDLCLKFIELQNPEDIIERCSLAGSLIQFLRNQNSLLKGRFLDELPQLKVLANKLSGSYLYQYDSIYIDSYYNTDVEIFDSYIELLNDDTLPLDLRLTITSMLAITVTNLTRKDFTINQQIEQTIDDVNNFLIEPFKQVFIDSIYVLLEIDDSATDTTKRLYRYTKHFKHDMFMYRSLNTLFSNNQTIDIVNFHMTKTDNSYTYNRLWPIANRFDYYPEAWTDDDTVASAIGCDQHYVSQPQSLLINQTVAANAILMLASMFHNRLDTVRIIVDLKGNVKKFALEEEPFHNSMFWLEESYKNVAIIVDDITEISSESFEACQECGDRIEDTYHFSCDECGIIYHDNCNEYQETSDNIYCSQCAENLAPECHRCMGPGEITCVSCDNLICNYHSTSCHECEYEYCEDHVQRHPHNDEWYICDTCLENLEPETEPCPCCGHDCDSTDIIECDSCNDTICTYCSHSDDAESLCDGCFNNEGNEEDDE